MTTEKMPDETVYKAQVNPAGRSIPLPAGVLIGGGVLLLLANLAGFHLMRLLWPGYVLGLGALLLWPAYSSTRERQHPLAFLAVPGAIIAAISVMLFVMNLTGHWESWAYAWTLLPPAGVAGAIYLKRFQPDSRVHKTGHRFIRGMVLFCMGLAVFFELLVFGSLGPWWPLLFIGYGIYLFARHRNGE